MSDTHAQEVERRVKEYLDRHHEALKDVRPHVLAGTATLTEGTWYVPVFAEHEPKRTSPYYEALGAVEEDLNEHERFEVFLVPAGALADARQNQ